MTGLPHLTTGAALRSEWRRTSTVRVTGWVLLLGLVGSALLGAFYAWVVLQMSADTPVSPVEATLVTTTKASVTTVVAGLLGVLGVTGDRRCGGLAMAVVLEPRRSRVLVAKAVVSGALAAALGVVGLAANALVAVGVLGTSGLVGDPWSWAGLVAGAVAVHAGWAVVGVAVGTLVRAAPVAVLVVVAGPWVVQRTLSVLALAGPGGDLVDRLVALSPVAASARLQSPLGVTSPVVLAGPDGGQQPLLLAALSFCVFVALALGVAGRAFAASDLRPD